MPLPKDLTQADLNHLRRYLPAPLVEALPPDRASPPPRLLEQCLAHLSRLFHLTGSHLPAYLVERVVQNPVPGQTGGQFMPGTLLFADISGFTAMSERLSRTGREGAEEITAIVNHYFGVMLAILSRHGGQLIKFGGDALLGLFLEPDSATHATRAALSMQAAMADFAETRTSQGIFPLHMKVGLHGGRFFAAQLGTPQGMEYALFGHDVNATAAAESAARKGQVVLDRATHAALALPCRAVPLPNHDAYLAAERLDAPEGALAEAPPPAPQFMQPTVENLRHLVKLLDALTPYLPAGLLARLSSDTASLSLEGEHRLVAVLFANVHGLGDLTDRLGPGREDQIVAALNRYYVAMDEAVQSFGGVINKIDLYDHGDKLLAFFGAPLAHEDDAERAVRAALAMQAALVEVNAVLPELAASFGPAPQAEAEGTGQALSLRQQIGLSYNYVFAGYAGTDWRHEYTVMGDTVNLAARLMGVAAPGSVIVNPDIWRKVKALFDMTPRGDVTLKGKSEPIPIFSVEGVRAIPEPVRGLEGIHSPLVGRNAEWGRLTAAVAQVLAGGGAILSVIGEAGLGKSRLVAELREHLNTTPGRAMRWMEGRCLSYTESISFYPLREIVRQLVDIHPDDGEAVAWTKLRQTLLRLPASDAASADLPYLANFLSLSLPDDLQASVRYLDAEALQRRTFVAIRTLLEASSRSNAAPLALILEDIHWCDQASLTLLEYLLPMVDRLPLLLILTHRPEREHASWQTHEKIGRDAERARRATDIVLERLTPDDTQQLLMNLVPLDRWPAETQTLILNRTEGNPLYLQELLRVLIDDGVLVRDDRGHWQLSGRGESVQVPDTLQGVLMTRLDRLEEPSRRTAQIASVIGRAFLYDVLSHVTPDQPTYLNTYMVELQRHEIVDEAQRQPELIYAFKHGLMQETCYGSLLARTRRTYHGKIAAYLESSGALDRREAESNVQLIAHHAYAAQDWPLALRYQAQAGQQAQKLFANNEAIDHFTKALHGAEQLPPEETREQRPAVHMALGELLTTAGKYEPAREHLLQAHGLAIERSDADAQAHACRWLARLHELRGEYPAAFEWIEQGLAVLGTRETAETAQLRITAGLIHSRQGDQEKAYQQGEHALRIARALGELTVLARSNGLLGITQLRRNSATAVEYFQRALELYQQAGDLQGQATAYNLMANALLATGQWAAADRAYRQARDIFDQLGDIYNRAFVDNNLGEILLKRGDVDGALAFYQSALHSMEQIGGSPYVLGALNNNLGSAFIRRGDAASARRHLSEGQRHFEQAQARDFLPELHRHLARAALIAGEMAEAEAQCRQALSVARELAMRGEEGNSLRVLGEIAARQGRFEEAAGPLAESVAILEQVADEYELAGSRFSLARVYAALGKHEDGLALLDRCIAVFDRLGAAMDLAAARSLREKIAQQA